MIFDQRMKLVKVSSSDLETTNTEASKFAAVFNV